MTSPEFGSGERITSGSDADLSSAVESLSAQLRTVSYLLETVAFLYTKAGLLLGESTGAATGGQSGATTPRRPGSPVQSAAELTKKSLSCQEERVVLLMSSGMSNREIARTMRLSEQTVKNYLSTAFRKLGAKNRTEAAAQLLRRAPDASHGDCAPTSLSDRSGAGRLLPAKEDQ